MSTANKSSAYRTRMLTTTAMLGALSGLLMLIEFPLGFIAPSFYKLDLSEIPVMIGTFAFGFRLGNDRLLGLSYRRLSETSPTSS